MTDQILLPPDPFFIHLSHILIISLCCLQELEKLREENRNLRRDMKKILKQYERLASSQGDKAGGCK